MRQVSAEFMLSKDARVNLLLCREKLAIDFSIELDIMRAMLREIFVVDGANDNNNDNAAGRRSISLRA
jgi:hypothetical protein